MFACQNFLQQSCRKFYNEQKLFYSHLMKMNTSCSKSAFKAVLVAILALSQIWLSPGASSLLDRFWRPHMSHSRPIWLLLQLTMLWNSASTPTLSTTPSHNRCRSRSIRRPSPCLNRSRAHRRGRPATEQRRHLVPICRPWPHSSAPSAHMTSTATPRTQWTRPFSPPSRSLARKAAAASSPSQTHSGELKRAPRCVAALQNSPTAPP